jgi:GWxTD domain-containing protein
MKLSFFYIFSFFILIFSIKTFPQSFNKTSYYNEAMADLDKQDVKSAEVLLKKSIEENSDPASLFELSKIYIDKNTISGRREARGLLEKAIWKEPHNIDLRLTYASLMEHYGKEIAFDKYQEIIEIDSTCSKAWYNMGRLRAIEFDDYHNSVNRANEYFNISFEKFAVNDFREAESYFIKALKYDSLNTDAYLKLSFLYEGFGKPEKGIPLLEKLVKLFPENKNAYLFLGLLCYEDSNISKSYNAYQNALLLMPVSERLDFTYNSVMELLDPVINETIKSLKPSETRKFIDAFWNASDPLFLTQYNERLLEHYSRVAYANLRFGLPDKAGWKTDRGEIFLRYGNPLKRTRFRPQINAGGRTVVQVKTDVWEYKDMVFGFEDDFWSGNFVFSEPFPGSRYIPQTTEDSYAFANYARRVRFEGYTPKYEGPAFSIPYNIAQFKNLDDPKNTDVYFNYALSYNDSLIKNNLINYKYEWGLFFNDDYFNSIYRYKDSVDNLPFSNIIKTDSTDYVVSSAEMTVKPDSGRLAFEIIRSADKGVSSNHLKFKTADFNSSNLGISSIIPAENINQEKSKILPITRKSISILPNPTLEFSKDNKLYLYYEVYNLGMNNENVTDFEQKITIQEAKNQSAFGETVNSVLNFIGLGKKDEEITLSSKYQTSEKNSQMYLQLDMNKSKPGKYIISVTVFDNILKKEVTGSTTINWQ